MKQNVNNTIQRWLEFFLRDLDGGSGVGAGMSNRPPVPVQVRQLPLKGVKPVGLGKPADPFDSINVFKN